MQPLKNRLSNSLITYHLSRLVRFLLRDEASSSRLILLGAFLALVIANSPLGTWYTTFWHTTFSIGLGDWHITHDLRHWVNEGLMAIFFLVAGLEIKRELTRGELRKFRAALLPIGAAVGGMLVPAILYLALNLGQPGANGWAIPMATDIALAIGVLVLLGDRIPPALKIFLLTLAIVDDIGAIVVIALFYADYINLLPLLAATGAGGAVLVLGRTKSLSLPAFLLLGIGMWIALHETGIHASITGALLGLLAPVRPHKRAKKSVTERLEKMLIPVSAFGIVPLFAFANAGIHLTPDVFSTEDAAFVAAGAWLGLSLGKVVGIAGASWLLVRLGITKLPNMVTWGHITGAGLIAGIGFTVSMFITDLAFASNEQLADAAKMSIFAASLTSALAGLLCIWKVTRRKVQEN